MENPEEMSGLREPRRPNLATIVGSGLAVVAAGSLLAFSSLAEQAGLQGLATRGIQPATPNRGGGDRVITIPAPATAPPAGPDGLLDQILGDTTLVAGVAGPATLPPFVEAPPSAPEPSKARKPKKPKRPRPTRPTEPVARVAVAPARPEPEAYSSEGPPYGHAYGHDKKPEKPHAPSPHPAKPKKADDAPMYARAANDDKHAKGPKPKKAKKVENRGLSKALGHDKHEGKGKSKGKGHKKHGH